MTLTIARELADLITQLLGRVGCEATPNELDRVDCDALLAGLRQSSRLAGCNWRTCSLERPVPNLGQKATIFLGKSPNSVAAASK